MKAFINTILFLVIMTCHTLGYAASFSNIPVCSANLSESQICYIQDMSPIHVAQFNYGEQYTNGLIDYYKNHTAQQNQAILDKIQFPLMISPNGKMYITKSIEQALAFNQLAEITHLQYKLYFKIVKKFPNDHTQLATEQFWKWMNNSHKAYVEDQGVAKSITQLPINITQVKNDPFLSLSKWLGESGWCYDVHQKDKFNNMEFIWADYLRDLVNEGQLALYQDSNPATQKGQHAKYIYLDYVKRVGVCHVNVADKLPGFCQYDQACSTN